MSIASVVYTYKGTEYTLTYNSSTGAYEATVPAGAVSSWDQTDHKFGGSVTATDNAGNTTTVDQDDFSTLGVRVLETDAPTVTITYDAESGVDTTSITLTIDSTTLDYEDLTISEPVSGTYTVTYTPDADLDDGSHTVSASATDNDGNTTTTAAATFIIDVVPPTLNVSAPIDGLVTNVSTVTVSGTTNDVTSTPVTLTVNGTTVSVAQDGSFSTTVNLVEGSNTITVVATDAAGLSSTVTRTVTLNTVAPTITSITITPNPVDAGQTFVISVVASDE